MTNSLNKDLSIVLDCLPKRLDPRIPIGRKSYFWTSIAIVIANLAVYFISYMLVIICLGDKAPSYLVDESVPYPYWFSFFSLPFLIPIHLLDFRRAKAACIHYSWVWFLVALSVVDCFYSLNSPDFISPITRLQGFIYIWFVFRKNRIEVPWPIQTQKKKNAQGNIKIARPNKEKSHNELDEDIRYIEKILGNLDKPK